MLARSVRAENVVNTPAPDRRLPALLLALTAATGLVDAVSYLALGHVFTAKLLLGSAALAAGGGGDLLRDFPRVYGLIVLTGLAMGVRNAVVRKLAEHDLTTTVLTLTITGIAADFSLAGNNPAWTRRALSIALMFAGAAAGAWLLLRYSVAMALAVSGIVSGVCALAALPGQTDAAV